jgi:hypothetical protein
MKNNYGFRRAGTITVPEQFFNPIKIGIPEADRAFSEMEGIVPSQVIFVTGKPGAGKTTLTLAIGSRLVRSDRPIAFISLEMSEFQIAHQARKIPNFNAVHITDDFDQDSTMEYLRELKPGLVILDSIQKAARKMRDEEGRILAFNTAQFEIVNMFTHFAKETWTPVCLIGHCDKSGNYKGPSDLLHDVDSHMLVNYDKELDIRTFEFGKNRFGGEPGENLFGFNSSGVWIGNPYYDPGILQEKIEEADQPQLLLPPSPISSEERVKLSFDALNNGWNPGNVRNACTSLVNLLKQVDEAPQETLIGNWNKVKLKFSGKGAGHCVPDEGLLVFGKGCVTNFDFGTIGYQKEKPYISRNCSTKPQLLAWVIVHEWCHLNRGMQHHKHEFFQLVESKYQKYVSGLF